MFFFFYEITDNYNKIGSWKISEKDSDLFGFSLGTTPRIISQNNHLERSSLETFILKIDLVMFWSKRIFSSKLKV